MVAPSFEIVTSCVPASLSDSHPKIKKKAYPDIIDEHFIKTHRAKRTFDDICYGLSRDHWSRA